MIRLYFVLCFFLSSLVFSSNGNHNLIEISKVNSHSLNGSELNFKIGFKDIQQQSYGLQWWFSENYFINGDILSVLKSDENRIYHKISLGSSFKVNSRYNYIVEIGIHKQRFDFSGDSNWYELTFSNNFSYNNILFDIMLTKFDFSSDNNSLLSLSFTYIIENLHSFNYIISIDEFLKLYPSINFSINI